MDIDVKNALDKVLKQCESFEHNGIHAKDMVVRDTLAFIREISTAGADDRFDLFSKLYLGNAYTAARYPRSENADIPLALELFCKVDAMAQGAGGWAAKSLLAYFTSLGKSYMSSAVDRKQIDVQRIAEQLNQMKAYADSVIPPKPEPKPVASSPLPQQPSASQAAAASAAEPEESLEELLKELNGMVGLAAVKKEVHQLVNLIQVKKKSEEFGIKTQDVSLHLVFYGNPGTGKTTVARKLSKIYRSLGVLSQGQLVEVDRGKLVAGYVGQTATKTQEEIDKAMGGILFIDEAYTLTHGKGETDFGQEAVDTILKAMEDHRDDFVVIVAGYPDLMKEFIASNPGLKSRFNQYINFEDYTAEELLAIFKQECKKQDLVLAEACEAFLKEYFESLYNNRAADYANARDVRNYFERVLRARANRLAENLANISREEFVTILLSDLQEAASNAATL